MKTMFFRLLLLLSLLPGCGRTTTTLAHDAAKGAYDELTSPQAEARYAALAAGTTKAAGDAARQSLLGRETTLEAQRLIVMLGQNLRMQTSTIIDASGDRLRANLQSILGPSLQESLRKTLRLEVDDALGIETRADLAALREELVGVALQKDVSGLIDAAAPHLAQAVQQAVAGAIAPVQAKADAEAAKWKPIALALSIGAALLFVCLVFVGWLLRGHQKTIRTLVEARR